MRSKALQSFLQHHINDLQWINYDTTFNVITFYERIGTIRICLDGETQHEVDLGQNLVNPQIDYPNTFGQMMADWRKETLELRRQVGLSVMEPKEPDPL